MLKRDKLDDVFSQLVRERSNWVCECCQRDFSMERGALHCSHIYGRVHRGTRWHPFNALSHCFACHGRLGMEPRLMSMHAEYELGAGTIERVSQLAMAPAHWTADQLEDLYHHYRKELQRIVLARIEGDNRRIEFYALPWYQQGVKKHHGQPFATPLPEYAQ